VEVGGVVFMDDEARHLTPQMLYSISQEIDYLSTVIRRPPKSKPYRLKGLFI
jgi:hypothetical protein